MAYKRKTVDRWKFDALVVMLGVVTVALLSAWIHIQVKAAFANEFITPLAQNDPIVIEKPIAVEVVRYETPDSVEAIIRAEFGEDADLAIRVAKCESGLNPKAANSTSSARGLFQVMQSWHQINEKWLFDPTINTKVAKRLFDESGGSFSPHWNASKHCWGH